MQIIRDEDFLVSEPCLSCEKSYMEDIWFEIMCDEKECVNKEEYYAAIKKPSEKI